MRWQRCGTKTAVDCIVHRHLRRLQLHPLGEAAAACGGQPIVEIGWLAKTDA